MTLGWWARVNESWRGNLEKSRTRLSDGLKKVFLHKKIDRETLANLEELLIACDVGIPASQKLVALLQQQKISPEASIEDIQVQLAKIIAGLLNTSASNFNLDRVQPLVILAVGVNGSGKTTTLSKLAAHFTQQKKKVLLAAGDTFRAGAVEQLEIWGKRLKVPVVTSEKGDASAVAFAALQQAIQEKYDCLLIDTAGRLHNKADLMAELQKTTRVLKKLDPTAPHETILVLDATIGQNAFNQVETFQSLIGLTGLIITKLDGTARGGVIIGLAERFKLPIYAIGVGEAAEDLRPFEALEFAANLVGVDPKQL